MNTTVEAMLTEILPKASVQELVERYGDPPDVALDVGPKCSL